MDNNGNVIRVFEGRGGADKCGIVKVPVRLAANDVCVSGLIAGACAGSAFAGWNMLSWGSSYGECRIA
jgi:hypothetical protein